MREGQREGRNGRREEGVEIWREEKERVVLGHDRNERKCEGRIEINKGNVKRREGRRNVVKEWKWLEIAKGKRRMKEIKKENKKEQKRQRKWVKRKKERILMKKENESVNGWSREREGSLKASKEDQNGGIEENQIERKKE